jgi:hypothetical protein
MRIAVMAVMVANSLASAADDAAIIVNSGSTNSDGYRIVVPKSGKAAYSSTSRRSPAPSNTKTRKLPGSMITRFYADIDAAKPLSDLPAARCMKSASFGTTLTIEIGGQKTPDLSCGDHGDGKLKALIRDATEISRLFTP